MSDLSRRDFLSLAATVGGAVVAYCSLRPARFVGAEDDMVRKSVVDRMQGSDEDLKILQDALNDFARVRFREQSFTHHLIPPVPVDSVLDVPGEFGTVQIGTPVFSRDVDEYKSGQIDIRKDVGDLATSIATELDASAIRMFNQMIEAATKVHGLGQRHVKRDKPLTFAALRKLDNEMFEQGYGLGLVCVPECDDVEDMRDWMSCPGDKPAKIRWVQTVKKDLVAPGTAYVFKDPIGRCFVPEDVTVFMERQAFMFQLSAWMNIGIGLYIDSGNAGKDNPQFDAFRFDYTA